MRLSGKDVCPNCYTVFEWGIIPNERKSVVSFVGLKTLCNNVENCHKAYDGDGYSITVKCPECGCRFKPKENKEEKKMKRFLCLFIAIVMCLMSIPALAMSLSFEDIKKIIDSTAVDDVHMFTDIQYFSDGGINSDAAYVSEGIALMWYEDTQQAEVLLFSSSNPKEGYKWNFAEAGMQYIRDAVLILSVVAEYNTEPVFSFIATESTHNAPLQYLSEHRPNADSEKFANEVAAYIKNNIAENTGTVESEATEAKQEEYTALQRGDKGDTVVVLQKRLNELGYSVGTADGDFGGKTEAAIIKFSEVNSKVYPEIKNSKKGIADESIQKLLFSEKALYNLEALTGKSIVSEANSIFAGSDYKNIAKDEYSDFTYKGMNAYDFEALLGELSQDEYNTLNEIKNWYIQIEKMHDGVKITVYDECKMKEVYGYFDGTTNKATLNSFKYILSVIKSIEGIQEKAERNGYNFYASTNYGNQSGWVSLTSSSKRESLISWFEKRIAVVESGLALFG